MLEWGFAAVAGLVAGYGLARLTGRGPAGAAPAAATVARLRQLESIFEALLVGVAAVDAAGHPIVVNRAARGLLGRNRELLAGPQVKRVLAVGSAEYAVELTAGHQTLLGDFLPIRGDDGEPAGVVAVFRDRRQVQHLAEQLTGYKQLNEALRARTHEFRNQLQVIAGLLNLGAYERLQAYVADLAATQAEMLGSLLTRLPDVTLVGLLLGKASRAAELGVQFHVSPRCRLSGPVVNSHALVTVLGNLLENALEEAAAQPPHRRMVDLLVIERRGHVLMRVQDRGRGVPPGQAEQIFTPTYTTKAGNRGMGLHLARRAAEACGGAVRCRLRAGGGTVFLAVLGSAYTPDPTAAGDRTAAGMNGPEGVQLV